MTREKKMSILSETNMSIVSDLPFTLIFNSIWSSLDDLLICIGIIIVTVPIVLAIGDTTHSYFKLSLYVSQMIKTSLLAFIFIYLLGYTAGETTSVSLLQGLSIGVGYALQPYIVSLLSGLTFFSTGMIKVGDSIIVEDRSYTIISNGIMYIEANLATPVVKKTIPEKDCTIYVPNNYFNNRYLKKMKN